MFEDKMTYLVGRNIPAREPVIPYDEHICEFLHAFSKQLMADKEAKQYGDVMSLAFWCRKTSIMKRKKAFLQGQNGMPCIGRGLAFHIAPSNVPVNFAFSYFFGLLSGNANIVRVPSRNFPQTEIICRVLNRVLEAEDYADIKKRTLLVSYERNQEINDYFSGLCDARIIWGGDAAIHAIRQSALKPRAVEVVFADRYSLAVMDAETVAKATEEELKNLADAFYNDTFLMDQNACSSPHLLYWAGRDKAYADMAENRFWDAVYQAAGKYPLEPIKAVDKYTDLCSLAMEREDIGKIRRYGNRLYTIELKGVPDDMTKLRGRFGMFFELAGEDFAELCPVIDEKTQTLLYYGMDKRDLTDMIIKNHLTGIDRIAPVGSSLDIDVIWDGYDIIGTLSRKIG